MEKRAILVTEGSRGIAQAVAPGAAARGWPVALSWHSDRAAADETVQRIEALGGQSVAIRADVAV